MSACCRASSRLVRCRVYSGVVPGPYGAVQGFEVARDVPPLHFTEPRCFFRLALCFELRACHILVPSL